MPQHFKYPLGKPKKSGPCPICGSDSRKIIKGKCNKCYEKLKAKDKAEKRKLWF